MYCTMRLEFQCPGHAEEAIPHFQAFLDSLKTMLRQDYPQLELEGIEDAVTRDDVSECPENENDIDDLTDGND